MATHTNILARRIPWTEEPGRIQSMGPQRVRHDEQQTWAALGSGENVSLAAMGGRCSSNIP